MRAKVEVEDSGTARGREVQRGDPRVPLDYGRGQKGMQRLRALSRGRNKSALGASASAGSAGRIGLC